MEADRKPSSDAGMSVVPLPDVGTSGRSSPRTGSLSLVLQRETHPAS